MLAIGMTFLVFSFSFSSLVTDLNNRSRETVIAIARVNFDSREETN
jgi:hypothetical protein